MTNQQSFTRLIVAEFSSLGLTTANFKVCAYDFFAYHYLTDFDGVIGLDFLKGTKLCIDMGKANYQLVLKNSYKSCTKHSFILKKCFINKNIK